MENTKNTGLKSIYGEDSVLDEKGSFVSNGNRYTVSGKVISYERSIAREKLLLELESGKSPGEFTTEIGKIIDMHQGRDARLADATIALHNLQMSAGHAVNRTDIVLRLLTIFILAEGEDPAKYDEELAEKKMADWKTDMDMNSFFLFAIKSIQDLTNIFKRTIPIFLGEDEEEAAPKKKA